MSVSYPRPAGVTLAEMRLPLTASSPKIARDLVAMTAQAWGLADLEYVAKLATSELVTNAFRYCTGMRGSTVLIVVTRADDLFRVEVHDGSKELPHKKSPTPTDTSGRGLSLVEEMVSLCGAYPTPFGKAVWFEITAQWPLDLAKSRKAKGGDANEAQRRNLLAGLRSSSVRNPPSISGQDTGIRSSPVP
ncbi:ATP-binding protein [Actinomadura alba]|uniref:ATP-binding protein n=1 Tax=Actinomadura alba TaxID=406431 RepID=A0ABR7M2S1_9ACTN|nr:ATP-binding protein [Actinomadura alba]MBC6470982.1 ATP-binding protein [Actinomadura alba]